MQAAGALTAVLSQALALAKGSRAALLKGDQASAQGLGGPLTTLAKLLQVDGRR
jgi:hypothetical protein